MSNSILKIFVKYTFFNIMSMVGMSAYVLADTLFIANKLGVNGLAALNISIPIFSFITCIGLMIGMGGATIFSFAKVIKEKNIMYTQTIYIALFFSKLFLLLGITLTKPISLLLGANNETLTMTNTYIQTILLFGPAFVFNSVFLCFIRNDNGPKIAMLAMLTGSIANIILDYLFIYPFKLGMFGASLATSLAPIISMLVLVTFFIRKQNTFHLIYIKNDIKKIVKIISLGISFLINELSSGIVIILFNLVILAISNNTGVAAYGIIANLAIIMISIFNGLAQGIQPITSKYYAENNTQYLKKILKFTIITGISIAFFSYSIILLFRFQIIELFNKDDNTLKELANTGLIIYFTSFFFSAINIPMISYFNSINKIKQSFIISILRGLLLIIPTLLILSFLFKINGVWFSIVLTEFITLILVIYFLITDVLKLLKQE